MTKTWTTEIDWGKDYKTGGPRINAPTLEDAEVILDLMKKAGRVPRTTEVQGEFIEKIDDGISEIGVIS